MRLYSFKIKNFRSIVDTGVVKISDIDNITIFAGQNESGKTSILEALAFFEGGVDEEFEDQQRRLGTSPSVECNYRLTKEELGLIQKETGSKDITKHLTDKGVTYRRGDPDKDAFGSFVFVYDPQLKELCESIVVEDDDPKTTYTIDALSKFVQPFRPEFIFYSSFEQSILPGKIKSPELASNQAILDFEKVFDVDFATLLTENDRLRAQKLESLNTRSSENLNEYWKQQIGEDSRYRYKVDAFPQTADPTESYITMYIDRGDNHPLSISQKSTGFRWFASFNLRLRAHQASHTEPGKFILLIDEPGQGLHEQAQKNVMRVLNEMGAKGWQLLYSTHLPQLLGGEDVDLSRIKLVIPSLEVGTKIRNIPQATTEQGFMDALSPIRTALGQVTLDVSTFLNGKKTVIVEGITDYYYFTALALLYGKQAKYSFVPPVGVTQTPNIYAILLGWGISPLVIVDGDRAGQKEFNKLKKGYFENSDESTQEKVYVNTDCDGVEDIFSTDDFKLFAVGIIPEDSLNSDDTNSKKAKDKKELLGRTFLDKVKDGSIAIATLSDETKQKVGAIFKFLEK